MPPELLDEQLAELQADLEKHPSQVIVSERTWQCAGMRARLLGRESGSDAAGTPRSAARGTPCGSPETPGNLCGARCRFPEELLDTELLQQPLGELLRH